MGGSLCNRAQTDRNENGEKNQLMHPPSIVEMKHGHICKHSKIFLDSEQKQKPKATGPGEEQTRKGVFYHPKIECLDSHPARVNTHLYTVYGGASQDQGQYVYLIDEHTINDD